MKQRPRFDASGGEALELKPKKAHQFVEAEVQDGDTLQAIALRFNCTVAALKTANGILRENEIFARKTVKIPVRAFSLLTEAPPAVHTSGKSSPTDAADGRKTAPSASNADLQQKLIVASVNASEVRPPSAPVDAPPRESVIAAEFDDDSSPLLSSRPLTANNSLEAVVVNEFAKGADFGLKWYHVLVFAFVIVLVPLIYVFYIAEHPEKYHHH